MNTITRRPIPNAVPKLVREIYWYFLKNEANLLSLASDMMAGLSERNVITAPSDDTPGRLNTGFISGRNSFSSRLTTPNSTNTLPKAPVITQMLMR